MKHSEATAELTAAWKTILAPRQRVHLKSKQHTCKVCQTCNPQRLTRKLVIIKMQKVKDKERVSKAARAKQFVLYKGAPIRLSADFSTETLQARREWQEIFKLMKSKDIQPSLLYLAKPSFTIKVQKKSFPDKKKLKEFITTKPVLHEIIKRSSLKRRKKDKKNMSSKM